MLKIEPIEEVVTKRSVVITLDEDGIAKVLVDARELQKELRKTRSEWYGPRAYINNGHAGAKQTRTSKKAAHPKAVKKSGKVRGVKCPKCHRVFKKLGRHVQTCTGQVDPLVAAARSVLDE